MSNKPNLKRKPIDVLVNYQILKSSNVPVDMEEVLKVVIKYVYTHPVYYHVDPVIHEGSVLFSLIGLPWDQEKARAAIHQGLAAHNCVLRYSKQLPVPKLWNSASKGCNNAHIYPCTESRGGLVSICGRSRD